ncbi:MAG: glutamate--cysteine ligase [Polyangiaceae bacterium]|nr:glutamate--cysteine ligase [Polyangiaceae bacterium]
MGSLTIDSVVPPEPATPITDRDQLTEIFAAAERDVADWLIGAEAEKFGVDATTGAPISFDGDRGVLRVLSALRMGHGWRADREHTQGPIIALRRGAASVTLEPGAQLELSGTPFPDLHAVAAEMRGHMSELRAISAELNLAWLAVGFHPLARQSDLAWVPKRRYAIMREYLPTRCTGGLDMMRRTATVQVNLDYSSEQDAMEKLRLALRMAPLANAMTANSPFLEGGLAGKRSLRGDVWLRMDPARSGLIQRLWREGRATYQDYVEWALDAGMFLFQREGQIIANTGQTFRSFLADGYAGHRATLADWHFHLNTLFPEVRLKRTLEVRSCDSLPNSLAMAVPALFTGVLYEARAFAAARELLAGFSYDEVERARPALVSAGLAARIGGTSAQRLAESLLEIAWGGLSRRALRTDPGVDETVYLARIRDLVASGRTPADVLTDGLYDGEADLAIEVLTRTRI